MLINKNVRVNGRKTSMRLEPLFWEALNIRARRGGVSPSALVSTIALGCETGNLTCAVRVACLRYYMEREILQVKAIP